eukprot:m.15515 g.15515  ORF g.15515 m.15515 type:complete len:800 (+) comp4487_c1_seq1:32-2431(+)
MTFAQEIFNRSVPEWREKYLDYDKLKQCIEMIVRWNPLHKGGLQEEDAISERLLGGLRGSFRVQHFEDSGDDGLYVKSELEMIRARQKEVYEERASKVKSSQQEQEFLFALEDEITKVGQFYLLQKGDLDNARGLLDEQIVYLWKARKIRHRESQAFFRSRPMNTRNAIINDRTTISSTAFKPPLSQSLSEEKTSALSTNVQRAVQTLPVNLGRKTKRLKNAFLEYYRALDLLSAYQALNITGFQRIVSKHDSRTGYNISIEFLHKMEKEPFCSDEVSIEMKRVEALFTDVFFDGDRARAMNELHIPVNVHHPFDHLTFQMGVFFALFVVGTVAGVIAASTSTTLSDYPHHKIFIVLMRPVMFPIIMLAFLGINAYVWRKFHVNYALIFSLNHRNVFDWRKMILWAGYLLFVCIVCVVVYLVNDEIEFNAAKYVGNMPFYLLCFFAAFLFLPHPLITKQRKWFLKVWLRILGSPFFDVRFEDFWLADQFNSMAIVLTDVQFSICYFSLGQFEPTEHDGQAICSSSRTAIRPLIACLPAWWRFGQCMRRYMQTKSKRHLANAGKYATSLLVVITSTALSLHKEHHGGGFENPEGWVLFSFWLIALIMNTSATMYWDFFQDWSVFEKNPTTGKFQFRKRRLYPLWMYIFGIVNNAIFRLTWTLTISVGFYEFFLKDGLVTVLGIGELWRRFCWNFFRLENEHLNNCGEFRAVKHIPMPFERSVGDQEFNNLDSINNADGYVVLKDSAESISDAFDEENIGALENSYDRDSDELEMTSQTDKAYDDDGDGDVCDGVCEIRCV